MRRLIPLIVLVVLAACSGGGNTGSSSALPPASPQGESSASVLVPMSATPTPMPTIVLRAGTINGLDNQFSPADADTSSGGNGQTVSSNPSIPCAASMVENKYHVHFFLGVLVNGKQMAIPDAIGMYLPGAEINGFTNSARCFYEIHTHDATGMIHIESPSTAPLGSPVFTLGNVLDVWGEPLTSTQFGPYAGTVRIFYATTNLGNTHSGATYYQYTGTTPRSIKLYSHEAIWIEVGSTYVPPSRLAHIIFYTEY